MPVFDYRCKGCDRVEEHIVLPGEEPPAACPHCGADLKRVWKANPHISFEGWGFSRTDGLIGDTRGKDFKALRERAERMRDE